MASAYLAIGQDKESCSTILASLVENALERCGQLRSTHVSLHRVDILGRLVERALCRPSGDEESGGQAHDH